MMKKVLGLIVVVSMFVFACTDEYDDTELQERVTKIEKTLDEVVKNLQNDVKALKADVKSLKEQETVSLEDFNTLLANFNTLQEDFNALKTSNNAQNTEIESIKSDIEEAKSSIEDMLDDIDTLEALCEQLNNSVTHNVTDMQAINKKLLNFGTNIGELYSTYFRESADFVASAKVVDNEGTNEIVYTIINNTSLDLEIDKDQYIDPKYNGNVTSDQYEQTGDVVSLAAGETLEFTKPYSADIAKHWENPEFTDLKISFPALINKLTFTLEKPMEIIR